MEENTQEVIFLLREQNELLRKLLAANSNTQLGFSDFPPGFAQWVFVGRNGDSCLYTLGSGGQQAPLSERALTGYITDVTVEEVTRRNKPTTKLNVKVKTQTTTYLVSGGYDTCFAKSLLASLTAITPEALKNPVTLFFAPGDDENVIWCKLYAPEIVKSPQWDAKTNFKAWTSIAIAKVKGLPIDEEAQASTTNVVTFPQKKPQQRQQQQTRTYQKPRQQALYPKHDSFVKRIMGITGHDRVWVIKCCRKYGGDCPGDLNPDLLKSLIRDMAADFGVKSGICIDDRKAITSYTSRVDFFVASGKRWGEGVISWFEEAKQHVS